MNKFSIGLLIAAIIFSAGCKNDLNVLAPYKETCIVYGLLNAADSVHYIRINRAFLGEEDAAIMAQHPDSFNYPDILDVTLSRFRNGVQLSTLALQRDSSINLEPGIFANTPNILYRTQAGDSIYTDSEYKLNIYNRNSGNTTSSKTIVLDNIAVQNPFPVPGSTNTIALTNSTPYKVKFYAEPDAAVYNLTVRFFYSEAPVTNPTATVLKYADWVQTDITNTANSSAIKELELTQDGLYQLLQSELTVDASMVRKFVTLHFNFTSGAETFYTYVQVNAPPTGIVQSIPDFTNIENGKGIFSSRYIKNVTGLNLDSRSLDSLFNGRFTKDLRFQ
jgi:hypothetical protein